MYRVKFYKKDYYYFYLFKDKIFIDKFLCFSTLINYIEENNIDFKKVRICCNLDDLFFHIVDYSSIKRLNSYTKLQNDKKQLLKECNK